MLLNVFVPSSGKLRKKDIPESLAMIGHLVNNAQWDAWEL